MTFLRSLLSIQRLVAVTILGFLLSNERAFKAFVDILVTFHISLRIFLGMILPFLPQSLPAFVEMVKEYLASLYATVTALVSPILQYILTTTTKLATAWLQESPRYLCAINGFMVNTGNRALEHSPADLDGTVEIEWLTAAKSIEEFCQAVYEWKEMGS